MPRSGYEPPNFVELRWFQIGPWWMTATIAHIHAAFKIVSLRIFYKAIADEPTSIAADAILVFLEFVLFVRESLVHIFNDSPQVGF